MAFRSWLIFTEVFFFEVPSPSGDGAIAAAACQSMTLAPLPFGPVSPKCYDPPRSKHGSRTADTEAEPELAQAT